MNIHEYQARQLFRTWGIPVPEERLCTTAEQARQAAQEFGGVTVIKAQVHTGGRGKAGGVKLAKNPAQAYEHAGAILGMQIKSFTVKKVIVVPGANIKKEFYMSLTLDRNTGQLMFIVSKAGGVDIEEVAASTPRKIKQVVIDPMLGVTGYKAWEIGAILSKDTSQIRQIGSICQKLYKCYLDNDLSLAEINPLILTKEGQVMAIDAKVNIDDNGLPRQKQIEEMRDLDMEEQSEIKARGANLSFVPLDGDIGCMVNGAGLAMATMDVIKLYGGDPANFLDVGGSSDPAKVIAAIDIIMSNPRVKGILINIFGGITRCDDIANGLVTALGQVKVHVPLIVRLTGTNEEQGKKILEDARSGVLSDVRLQAATGMDEAVRKVVEAAKS